MTPLTGDYGADLILHKDHQRIAVQAKCYTGSVGVASVQEALSGMAYYQCQTAWVITTGNYTMERARNNLSNLYNCRFRHGDIIPLPQMLIKDNSH